MRLLVPVGAGGILKDTKLANSDIIRRHSQKKTHKKVMKLYTDQKLFGANYDVKTLLKSLEQSHHIVTNRHMRTVFVAAKKYLSFQSHCPMVRMQEINGIDMGHLCCNGQAAQKMALAISRVYHRELVAEICDSDKPFSVILDGSTDRSQAHTMAVLFQYVTKEKVVKFCR